MMGRTGISRTHPVPRHPCRVGSATEHGKDAVAPGSRRPTRRGDEGGGGTGLDVRIEYNGAMPTFLASFVLPLMLLATHATQPATRPSDVDRVAEWLTGSFDSSRQAADDDRYFDISLHVVPIWEGRDNGPWLYVEQAVSAAADRPYRQRVYRVVEREGAVVSEVYTLPGDAMAFAGKWREPAAFDAISPEDLEKRDGCAVFLTRDGDRYVGGTRGEGCASTLQGAAYATSEVVVTSDRLESWDRGFDEADRQVWGAEAGPYVFRRTGPSTRPAGRRY